MSNPFVAEIRIFGFNFPPTGWAFCDGQILPISQNTALFSLLGTTYGGDGKTNFGLPNLQGCVVMQPGQGPGLSLYDLGQTGGSETVTLLQGEMAAHPHTLQASSGAADEEGVKSPVGTAPGVPQPTAAFYAPLSSNVTPMAPQMLSPAGNGQPHNNMQPYVTLNYCIAIQGVFPPRG